MDGARLCQLRPVRHTKGKQNQQQCRGQREPQPGRQCAPPACAPQAQRHAHLAAGRPRQKLAQRHQVRIACVIQPPATHHQFTAKVAEVGNRPAKRGQPQLQKYPQHFQKAACRALWRRGVRLAARGCGWLWSGRWQGRHGAEFSAIRVALLMQQSPACDTDSLRCVPNAIYSIAA